jgi:hypothetical protein
MYMAEKKQISLAQYYFLIAQNEYPQCSRQVIKLAKLVIKIRTIMVSISKVFINLVFYCLVIFVVVKRFCN